MRQLFLLAAIICFGMAAIKFCTARMKPNNTPVESRPAKLDDGVLTPEQAKARMEENPDLILLDVRTHLVRLHAGNAFLRACINNGEVKLIRRGAKLHKKLKRFVNNFVRPCAGTVHLVHNNNRHLVQFKRFPEHEAGLRHTAFKCIDQQQHALTIEAPSGIR